MRFLTLLALAAAAFSITAQSSTIVTRAAEGTTLTWTQVDTNFKKAAQNKTADYTIVIGDNRDTIEFNGSSLTATMPAAATIIASADTADFEVTLINLNASALTVARSSTDTFNGATSYSLKQYESALFKVNHAGTGWDVLTPRVFTTATISGGTIDDSAIGGTTPAAGSFTTGAFSGAVSSTKSCASGYTRLTPNQCYRNDASTFTNLSALQTTIAAPSGATLVVLRLKLFPSAASAITIKAMDSGFSSTYDQAYLSNSSGVTVITTPLLKCPVSGGNIYISASLFTYASYVIVSYYD